MIDLQIQTYWNVETLYFIFNAVASFMGGAGFSGLMKLVFLVGVAIGMFAYALSNKTLEFVTWFIQALIFVTVLNLPIARVILTDKTGLEPPKTVDHVPFALAVIAQTNNLIWGSLASGYETVFGVPDDLGLAKGDIGFGHRILKQVGNATIADPGLRADLMQFIKECTLYDIKDGVITPQQIIGGNDVFTTIFDNSSPARFVTHETLTPNPQTDTCEYTGNTVLKTRVAAAVTAAQTFYGKQAFSRATSDAVATSMFVSAVGTSYDWILASSQNASDAMRQAMFNNIWREAGTELPALLNDPARVAEVNALAASAQAARQANGANSAMAILGQEQMPHMRNWIEAIIYASFPIVVVLMVVVSTDAAKRILAGYMMMMVWIGLWPVLYAVINHLSLMMLQHKAHGLALAGGVPFQLTDAFDATLADEQSMIGYMVLSVPFIAAGIIKLSQGGFTGMADRLMTGFTAAGQNIGSQMASGNMNLGQTSLDSASVNNTSMHKYDSNVGLSGGGATIGRSAGGAITMAPNGSASLQQMHNQFLSSMGVDRRYDSQRSQDAGHNSVSSVGDQLSSRHSDAASLSHVRGHDRTRGDFQSTGVDAATVRQGGQSGTTGHGQSVNRTNRDGSTQHMSVGATDNLNMGLGVSTPYSGGAGGVGGGGRRGAAGAGAGAASYDSKEEKRIEDALSKAGASKQEIDSAKEKYRAEHGGPTEASRGSASNQPSRVRANIGFNSQKTYSAAHQRNKSHDESHAKDEFARKETNYSETSARTVRASEGQQSAQNDKEAMDATRSKVDELSRTRDSSGRDDRSIGNRASRSESNSFNEHADLLADPSFMEAVAHRNKMSITRLYNQETPTIMAMAREYAEEKGIVQASQTLNNITFEGNKLATTSQELKKQTAADRKSVAVDVDKKDSQNVAQTGFAGVQPVKVDTSEPKVVSQSEGAVNGNLDPANKNSIPSRTSGFDEHVEAYASHDKEMGAARANQMALVEQAEWTDGKDYLNKAWDKVKGGDGLADGEKITENMKQQNGATIPMHGAQQGGQTATTANEHRDSAASPGVMQQDLPTSPATRKEEK